MVMVQGTVSGSNVTATMIRDGVGMTGRGGFSFPGRATSTATNATPPIQGNGEPVIGGSVTAINGSTLTVTNASNVTYTIDVSNAKIVKNGVTSNGLGCRDWRQCYRAGHGKRHVCSCVVRY